MLQLRKGWALRQGLPPSQAGQLTTYFVTHDEPVEGSSEGPAPWSGHANYTTMEEIPTGEVVLAGMFFLNEHPIIILFDSGASHDFMSSTCAKKANLILVASGAPYVMSTPGGRVKADCIT
jgi:hypothetical protein